MSSAVGAAIELHPKLAGRTDSIEKIVVTMMDAPMIRDQQAGGWQADAIAKMGGGSVHA